MRTTLTIDDDLLAAAKAMALARSVSIGTVVSEIMRKGLEAKSEFALKNNFPVFSIDKKKARPITIDDVKKYEDEL